MNDIIAACCTPVGRGAVAIIRLSGQGCIELASRLFSPMPKQHGSMRVGVFTAEHFKDKGFCVYFKAPKSYTGEDMVEFHLHGGRAIVQGALQACFKEGARLAERGEFSQRGFVNGKLSLESAEGTIEMIDAECASAVRCGYDMLSSQLTVKVNELESKLLHISSLIEAALDYPEENLDAEFDKISSSLLQDILNEVQSILKASENAPVYRNGADVAIIGPVNAGKSSILNALTLSDRAIVSSKAGTTRDIITAALDIGDMRFNLFDTAGLRETQDEIEAEGISRSRRAAENCDLVMFVTDKPLESSELSYLQALSKPYIVVFNKQDVRDNSYEGGLNLSAFGELSSLKQALLSAFPHSEGIVVMNARMLAALKKAYAALEQCAVEIKKGGTADIIAFFLRESLSAFSDITGENVSDNVVREIFSRFCLGK